MSVKTVAMETSVVVELVGHFAFNGVTAIYEIQDYIQNYRLKRIQDKIFCKEILLGTSFNFVLFV